MFQNAEFHLLFPYFMLYPTLIFTTFVRGFIGVIQRRGVLKAVGDNTSNHNGHAVLDRSEAGIVSLKSALVEVVLCHSLCHYVGRDFEMVQ
jgi:hypothetical protein